MRSTPCYTLPLEARATAMERDGKVVCSS